MVLGLLSEKLITNCNDFCSVDRIELSVIKDEEYY